MVACTGLQADNIIDSDIIKFRIPTRYFFTETQETRKAKTRFFEFFLTDAQRLYSRDYIPIFFQNMQTKT